MGFFSKLNGPLREEQTAPEDLLGSGIKAAAEAVAGLAAPASGTQDSASTTQPQVTGTGAASRTEASRSNVDRTLELQPAAKPPKVKGAEGDIQVTSSTDDMLTAQEQADMAVINQREADYTYAVGAAELQAGRSSVAAMQQWGEMNQEAYEGRKRLIDQEFPKWRRANEQLSQDIDDARRLKVNPYNYMQSVGRAGRVASVLAVGVGQLAAGAGNPNSVYQRLEAAIKRDVAAQKDNITNTWKGISMKRELQQDEIALLEQQFNFEDRAMAVAYASLAAQMGAAKQHARNETVYLNTQMVEERALAASIQYAAQARAKLASFMLDAKVHTVYGAFQKAKTGRQIREIRQAQIQAEADARGAQSVTATDDLGGDLKNLAGDTVGTPSSTSGAPAAAQTPLAQPGAAPTSAQSSRPTPKAAAAATDRRRAPAAPQSPAAVQDAPLGTGPLSNATVDATAPAAEAPATEQPAASPAQAREPQISMADKYGDETVRKPGVGSWERADQLAKGFNPSARTLDEMVAHVNDPNVVDYAIAGNMNDANILAKELKAPSRKDPVFGGRTDGEGNAIAPENTMEYQAALRNYKQLKKFPEAFMREMPNKDLNTGAFEEGRNNVIALANGDVLHIRTDQKELLTSDKKRAEVQEQIDKQYHAADRLAKAAATYQRSGGIKGVFGFKVDTEGGIKWEPANPEMVAAAKEMESIFLTTGIEAIKSVDPQGRLSDQDVGFGREMVSIMAERTPVSLDQLMALYTRFFEKPGTLSDIRLAAGRVFGAAIKNYLSRMDTAISSRVVMSGEAIQMAQERANRVNGAIHGFEETFKNQQGRVKAEAKEVEAVESGKSPEDKLLDDLGVNPLNPNDVVRGMTALPRYLYRKGTKLYDAMTDEEVTD